MKRADRNTLNRYIREFESAVRTDEMAGSMSPEVTRAETQRSVDVTRKRIVKFVELLVEG